MQLCSKCQRENTVYEICLSCRGAGLYTNKKKPPLRAIAILLLLPIILYFGYGFITKDAKVADELLSESATPVMEDTANTKPDIAEPISDPALVDQLPTPSVMPGIPEQSVGIGTTSVVTSQNGTLERLLPKVPEMYSGTFKYTLPDPSTGFVHWDACRALEYVVNTENAPAGSMDILFDAIGRISEASGLKFSYLGTTNEKLGDTRSMYQPNKYRTSTGWAPILVVFQNDAEFDASVIQNGYRSGNVKDVKGFATPLPAENNVTAAKGQSSRTYVSGVISIRSSFAQSSINSKDKETLLGIYIHELGHLVGLAHVSDQNEIMYYMADNSQYGPGDLQGLAIVGGQSCLDKVSYPVPYNLIADFNS